MNEEEDEFWQNVENEYQERMQLYLNLNTDRDEWEENERKRQVPNG
jgi:hypothetical protein